MKRLPSYISIGILGALVLFVGTQVSAAGFGRTQMELPQESIDALKECQTQFSTMEERQACAEEVAQEQGFELPAFKGNGIHRGFNQSGRNGMMQPNFPEEAKEAMLECHNMEDISERHDCMQNVKSEYGLPEFAGRPVMRGGCVFDPEIMEGLSDLTDDNRASFLEEVKQLLEKYKAE